jgi:hypothetical protein
VEIPVDLISDLLILLLGWGIGMLGGYRLGYVQATAASQTTIERRHRQQKD